MTIKDIKKYAAEISVQMYMQQSNNMHESDGCTYYASSDFDKENVTLHLTKDMLKKETNRKKLRTVVLEQFKTELEKGDLVVEEENGDFIITTKKESDCKFTSLSDLNMNICKEHNEKPETQYNYINNEKYKS